jgi:hypothetical protein
LAGFCMRTILSQLRMLRGSNARLICNLSVSHVQLSSSLETKKGGGIPYLAHCIHGCLTKLMGEVVPLDETDTMFTLR